MKTPSLFYVITVAYLNQIYDSPAAGANLHNPKTTPFHSKEQSSVIFCTQILCKGITRSVLEIQHLINLQILEDVHCASRVASVL